MGQFVGCIEGMAEACAVLDMPIVSGNVSLYNETTDAHGKATPVLPTPAIGGVGLLADIEKMATIGFKAEGETIFVIGAVTGHLGQSLWLRELHGREDGTPPPVDLATEKAHGDFVRELIAQGKVTAVHDISDGGLLAAIAEMALAGKIGAELEQIGDHQTAFGEEQARYVVTSAKAEEIQAAGLPMTRIGTTGGDAIKIAGSAIGLTELRDANGSFFPQLMER